MTLPAPTPQIERARLAQTEGAVPGHCPARLPEAFRDSRMLLVSPHFDDAVLSCEALVGRDRQADVLTVFTGAPSGGETSDWDRVCGFGSPAEAMAARKAEDRAAFRGTPHAHHHLGLLDAQYVPAGARGEEDAQALTRWVDRWLEAVPGPALVLLPAVAGASRPSDGARAAAAWLLHALRRRVRGGSPGGGAKTNHDHAWVRDVLARHLAGRRTRIALYEEFPYLLGQPADRAAKRLARRLGARIERFDIAIDRQAKLARIGAYRSQLPHLMSGRHLESALPPTERYWLLTPS